MLTVMTVSASAAHSVNVNLGSGWRARIDGPLNAHQGKFHGHVYHGNKQIGAENVDGTKHDGRSFSSVPKKKVAKLKGSAKWKEAKEKNGKLMKQRSKLTFSNIGYWISSHTMILEL